jgi:hypothetical protein
MFSFNSNRRVWWRSAFALLVVSCLFAALLFTGCKNDADDDTVVTAPNTLLGTWTASYGDGYTITSTHITYGYPSSITSAGEIKSVSKFSDTAGVIIIKYDADHKPTYYGSWEEQPVGSGNWVGVNPQPLKGDFIGIYYKDLVPNVSVKLGNAYAEGGAEEATLDAAKKAFIEANESTYMGQYGTYLKP